MSSSLTNPPHFLLCFTADDPISSGWTALAGMRVGLVGEVGARTTPMRHAVVVAGLVLAQGLVGAVRGELLAITVAA